MKKFLFALLLLSAVPATGIAAGCGTAGGTCTSADVAPHNTQQDCWVYMTGAINKVYNISPFLNGSHPAGNMIILPYCGKDMYAPFMTSAGGHAHSSYALNTLLAGYYVAPYVVVAPTPVTPPTATSTATTTPPTPTPTATSTATTTQGTCVSFAKDLKYRGRDNEVSDLQKFLIKKGLLKDDATGYFGKASLGAVKKFQESRGISATGYVGAITRAKIKEISCYKDDDHDNDGIIDSRDLDDDNDGILDVDDDEDDEYRGGIQTTQATQTPQVSTQNREKSRRERKDD